MSRTILPDPPTELKELSEALCQRLRAEVAGSGPMPFSRYMDRVLYEPGLGYYSAGLHKIGAGGDFVTAPELGGLFAGCIARQVAEVADKLGRFEILELGAGTGRLASGILSQLPPERHPGAYRILETSADLRREQRRWISAQTPQWLDRVIWLDEPPT